MKKIKWTIMTLIISLSVGGAFATAPHFDCRTAQQYYNAGGAYMPTGTFGVSYVCDQSSNACTYTYDGVNYTPCRAGDYHPLLTGVDKTEKPTNK